jgi:hypothetical protein
MYICQRHGTPTLLHQALHSLLCTPVKNEVSFLALWKPILTYPSSVKKKGNNVQWHYIWMFANLDLCFEFINSLPESGERLAVVIVERYQVLVFCGLGESGVHVSISGATCAASSSH